MAPFLSPLASLEQIQSTPSRADGIPEDVEEELRAYGCKLIQQCGVLLKQNQVAMSTAQVLFQRFWYVTSMKQFAIGEVGMGALYLGSKLEESPVKMRDIINVYDLVVSRAKHSSTSEFKHKPIPYFSERFYELKDALVVAEMQILKRLGFHVSVVLPYGTLVNYLQVLGLVSHESACQRAWAYLNDALQTPVYALYAVPTIVCAAIFLTCRDLSIPLPDEWYVLFDAEWDDVWSVSGRIKRLYRKKNARSQLDLPTLLEKKGLREWLAKRTQQEEVRTPR